MPIKAEHLIPEGCTEEDSILLCPICNDPPDYCQDHKHWLCSRCSEPLDINDDGFWECPHDNGFQ